MKTSIFYCLAFLFLLFTFSCIDHGSDDFSKSYNYDLYEEVKENIPYGVTSQGRVFISESLCRQIAKTNFPNDIRVCAIVVNYEKLSNFEIISDKDRIFINLAKKGKYFVGPTVESFAKVPFYFNINGNFFPATVVSVESSDSLNSNILLNKRESAFLYYN